MKNIDDEMRMLDVYAHYYMDIDGTIVTIPRDDDLVEQHITSRADALHVLYLLDKKLENRLYILQVNISKFDNTCKIRYILKQRDDIAKLLVNRLIDVKPSDVYPLNKTLKDIVKPFMKTQDHYDITMKKLLDFEARKNEEVRNIQSRIDSLVMERDKRNRNISVASQYRGAELKEIPGMYFAYSMSEELVDIIEEYLKNTKQQ